ncbi:MAG: hypothetical protein LBM94_04105 [Propionibacteriaceae bacterium]|jgi:hypothetical protein|nr:hypothetical protein [Propionibacteriaceae bacterium]
MSGVFIVIGLVASLFAIGVLATARFGEAETALLTAQGGGAGWGRR